MFIDIAKVFDLAPARVFFGNSDNFVVGFAMVVMMNWRPRGFVAARTPTIFLGARKTIDAGLVQEGRG